MKGKRLLKAIHAQEDAKSASAKNTEVAKKLKDMKLTRVADLVANRGHETLIYFGFQSNHWRQITTNNPLERIFREIRRRTRVVGASQTVTVRSCSWPQGSDTSLLLDGESDDISQWKLY